MDIQDLLLLSIEERLFFGLVMPFLSVALSYGAIVVLFGVSDDD